jgi:hypothetical protein
MASVETLGRAFGLYRRTAAERSAVVLVVANAIPLVGVLFFGWSLWTILVTYWIENGIVGFWNVPRLLVAGAAPVEEQPGGGLRDDLAVTLRMARSGLADDGRRGLVGFFIVHYGIFWLVHGVFVLSLPDVVFQAPGAATGEPLPSLGTAATAGFGEILWPYALLAAVGLFISHGASFFLNFVRRGEYRRTTTSAQMFGPYPRLIVLHLTILIGGAAIAEIGAPVAALVVMIALKTFFDLTVHVLQHRGRLVAA